MFVGVWVAGSAFAWELNGERWREDAFPLQIDIGGECNANLPEGACEEELAAAMAFWEVDCTPVRFELGGWVEGGAVLDGANVVAFSDPDDVLEVGVLGWPFLYAEVSDPLSEASAWEDTFDPLREADVVIADLPFFGTHAASTASTCEDLHNLREVLTHELGHVLGLGHSCEIGECTDLEREDVMKAALGECEASSDSSDALAGIRALYGPAVGVRCSPDLSGQAVVAPVEVTCEAFLEDHSTADALTEVVWDWDDGTTATGATATKRYTAAGTYEPTAIARGTSAYCAASTFEERLWPGWLVVEADPAAGEGRAGCGCSGGAPPAAGIGLFGVAAVGWRRRRTRRVGGLS